MTGRPSAKKKAATAARRTADAQVAAAAAAAVQPYNPRYDPELVGAEVSSLCLRVRAAASDIGDHVTADPVEEPAWL